MYSNSVHNYIAAGVLKSRKNNLKQGLFSYRVRMLAELKKKEVA